MGDVVQFGLALLLLSSISAVSAGETDNLFESCNPDVDQATLLCRIQLNPSQAPAVVQPDQVLDQPKPYILDQKSNPAVCKVERGQPVTVIIRGSYKISIGTKWYNKGKIGLQDGRLRWGVEKDGRWVDHDGNGDAPCTHHMEKVAVLINKKCAPLSEPPLCTPSQTRPVQGGTYTFKTNADENGLISISINDSSKDGFNDGFGDNEDNPFMKDPITAYVYGQVPTQPYPMVNFQGR